MKSGQCGKRYVFICSHTVEGFPDAISVTMAEPPPPPPPKPVTLPGGEPPPPLNPPPAAERMLSIPSHVSAEPTRTDLPPERPEIQCRPMHKMRVGCATSWIGDEVVNMSRSSLGWGSVTSMVARHHVCWTPPKTIIVQMVQSPDAFWICQFCNGILCGRHWHACLL